MRMGENEQPETLPDAHPRCSEKKNTVFIQAFVQSLRTFRGVALQRRGATGVQGPPLWTGPRALQPL